MAAGLRLEVRIDDKGSASIKKVENAEKRFEKQVRGSEARVRKAINATRATWSRARATMAKYAMFAKLALAGVAAAAVVTGAKFEQSMANIQAVSGATAEEFRRLEEAARGLGATTVFKASEASEAMLALAQAGQKTGQILESTSQVLLFAGAASTSLGSAAETLVATLAMFNLAATESARVVNVFAASMSVSLLNAERLKEGLAAVGSTASASGMRLEETVAALALLNSAGNLGGIAGTRLKNVLTRLQAPNAMMTRLLGESTFATLGLIGAMEKMKDASPEEMFRAFGRIAAPAVLVMRRMTTELKGLEGQITGTNKAQKMFEVQMDTLQSQFKIFRSQVEEVFIATFKAMRDAGVDGFNALTEGLAKIKPLIVGAVAATVRWIRENAGMIKGALKLGVQLLAAGIAFAILSKAVAVGIALWNIAVLIWVGSVKVFGAMRTAILAVRSAATLAWVAIQVFSLGWPLLIAAAVAALVGIIAWFIKTNDKARDVFDSIAEKAKWLGEKIWAGVKWPFVKIGELAVKAAGVFQRVFPGAAAAVESMFEVLKEKGGAAVDFVVDKGKAAGSAVVGAVGDVAGAVVDGVGGAIDGVKAKFDNFVQDMMAEGARVAGSVAAPTGAGGLVLPTRRVQAGPIAGMEVVVEGPGLPTEELEALKQERIRIITNEEAEKLRLVLAAEDQKRAAIVTTIGTAAMHTQRWLASRLELIALNYEEELVNGELTATELAQAQIDRDAEVVAAKMEHRRAVTDQERAAIVTTIGIAEMHTKEWLASRLELIKLNFEEERDSGELTATELAQAQIDRDAQVAGAKMEHQTAVMEHWMETHQSQLFAIDALDAAMESAFSTALDREMTGKKRREKIWKDTQRFFVSSWAKSFRNVLREQLIGLAVARSAKDADNVKDRLQGAKTGAIKAYSAFAGIPIIGPILGAAAAVAAFAFLIAFQKGGQVPGVSRGKDSVHGVLEPGEFVVRQPSASSVGRENLEHINRTGQLPVSSNVEVGISVEAGGASDEFVEELQTLMDEEVAPAIEEMRRRQILKRRRAA